MRILSTRAPVYNQFSRISNTKENGCKHESNVYRTGP